MPIPSNILKNARELRSRLTDAEQLLWYLLRNRRFCGYKFRRQHPVGRFILEFYCHEERLAIELDGSGHCFDMQLVYDAVRTKELEGVGLIVLRFWNSDVLENLESVLESILAALSHSPGAARHPLPQGEEKHHQP